jgi:sugar lactone lactonase YvrE
MIAGFAMSQDASAQSCVLPGAGGAAPGIELTPSDGSALDDQFGKSVAVSGNTAVIGAWEKNGFQGAAYVFVLSGGVWSQQAELTASDGVAGDGFGTSVAVSGNTAVIGAYGKNNYRGAAYVFVLSGGVWTQQRELTASDGVAQDFFGTSVALSGNTGVIGAPNHNIRGAAYVFVLSAGETQQQELTASDGAADDFFGTSVALSGNTAVIGAYRKNSAQGAAYVFVLSGGVWTQQQELTDSDGAADDEFGASVAVSGNTALIGETGGGIPLSPGFPGPGAVYVFVLSEGVWSQQQELTASDGFGHFGNSVAVSGSTAVIGENDNGTNSAASVFVLSGGVWRPQQELELTGRGETIAAVSGDTVVIGAFLSSEGVNEDVAYVFEVSTIGANALLVGSAGGTSSIVLTDSDAWTATSNSSFLQVPAGSASGTGNAVVVFTYDAFTGTGTRTGTLTIAGNTVTVTQAGTNYIGPGPVITLVSSGLKDPPGVAVGGSGNVYIADGGNNAIREWSASTQQVTTLVSSGLNYPDGVAVDGSGNVYFADSGNNAIKEWSAATGQVTTLVSSGLNGSGQVAVDGSGNVYIADTFNSAIKEWYAATGQVTALVSSGLFRAFGVAVDVSGNVYIADTGNKAIKEWNAVTGQVTTLVSSGLLETFGVAVDGSGNVYIADGFIKEWSAATGQVTTLVSSGLENPTGVAVDGSGNIYIADSLNNAIREVPCAFVGPPSLTEPASAGADTLLQVLPATASLTGIFAPTSDQSWLTIGSIANGAIGFSFTANTSVARTAHITVLGQQITVTQAALQSIVVTPESPSIAKGLTQQFTATGTYTDGSTQNLTSQVTWASGTIGVATISTGGLATVVAASGTSIISATLGAVVGSTTLTATPAIPVSIAVTPASPSIAKGLTQQFTATGTYTDNSTANLTSTVTWNSATTSVATIVSGGLATGAGQGTSNITASQNGVTSPVDVLTVTAPALVSIAVTPASPSIAKGLTEQFTATGTYTDNSTQNLTTSVTWNSATPTVATIASGGLATGVGQGTSQITASFGGVTSPADLLTVTAPALVSIAVTPASPSIAKGLTEQFTATGPTRTTVSRI